MKAKEIKIELEKNYGWNFSSEENMEMYYDLFLDVQKVVLRLHNVVGQSEQCCEPLPKDSFYLGTTCPKCNKPFRSVKQTVR